MTFEFTLLGATAYFDLPSGVMGWSGLLALLGIAAYLVWRWRAYHPRFERRHWLLLLLLIVLVPFASLFVAVRLPVGGALPLPGRPIELQGPLLVLFLLLPLALAAGFLGPLPAALLGAFSGALLAFWETHHLFTPLEFALLAVLFSACFRQRYRTLAYKLLRHPLAAALTVAAGYPIFYILVTSLFVVNDTFPARLDFALSRVGWASAAMLGQLFVAGGFAEIAAAAFPKAWGSRSGLIPSPGEQSLEVRFIYTIGSLVAVLLFILVIGDWIIAGNAAEQLIRDQMAGTAQTVAQSIPFLLETGQNLIVEFAGDEQLAGATPEQADQILQDDLRSVPYFRQLYLMDELGRPVTGYPVLDFQSLFLTAEERLGIELALQGVSFQFYTVPPAEGEAAAQLSFLATLQDDATGEVRGVLLGRSGLSSNPFSQPIIENLESVTALGGEAVLVDENGVIVYHPLLDRVGTVYTGRIEESPLFYDEPGPDGRRFLSYYQPVVGRSWGVATSIPAQRAQQLALNIAIPLLLLLLLLSLVAFILLRFALRKLISSLHRLAGETDRIASGDLSNPLQVEGVDEIGQLGRAFEQMRQGLQARLEEINRILLVSQGVASSLEIQAAVDPILEAALTSGAAAARLVLASPLSPDFDEETPREFGHGKEQEALKAFDPQILQLSKRQAEVVLTNPGRALDPVETDVSMPVALMAMALRHEQHNYGVLWIAFDEPHKFSEDEKRFLRTLTGQAALAASNAQLYSSAEIGRQRMEAILESTPDPVLVTDHKDRLLLANPAALELFGNLPKSPNGQPIEKIVPQKELLELLHSNGSGARSAEISFAKKRVFYASASPIMTDGQPVGRVCVLRDITHLKELDAMKSEFVSTVSHDLRSPLTLIRGYATMLEMGSALNEQQVGYVHKILEGIDSMARLVNNLLDLGRIEAGIGLKLEDVSLPEIVKEVMQAYRAQATQKKIDLTIDVPPDPLPLVEGDAALLQQCFQNLIENAVKYTETGGKVQIGLALRKDGIEVAVRDTGIGVAPVDQPRLFERFYRASERETRKQPGSGLGLTIVRSIAERHQGKVWFESKLGKGSIFYLLIPLQQGRK
jgi:PAS domain S-box-containing protein